MDIQQAVNESLQELNDDGTLKELIKKQLVKTIGDTVESLLRPYGKFGEVLKTKIETEMSVNLDRLSFDNYAAALIPIISQELDQTVLASAKTQISKLIESYVGKLEKSEWKLSEIIQQWKTAQMQYEDDRDGQIGFQCDESEYTPGMHFIGFGDETIGGRSNYSSFSYPYQLVIREDGTLSDFKIKGRTPQQVRDGIATGFEALLFKLYASQATIIVDEHDVNLDWTERYD